MHISFTLSGTGLNILSDIVWGNHERGDAAMPNGDHVFEGRWELIPELSLYEVGKPPATGLYCITVHDDIASFEISWTMKENDQVHKAEFSGKMDGSCNPLVLPPDAPESIPDGMTITQIDEWTLDSEALRGGIRRAYARRSVSHDGMLLAVMQESLPAQGEKTRNFQIYKRVGS